jgi:hypothetical protein
MIKFFSSLPWYLKALIGVVVLVLLIWFKDSIGGGIEKFNRWRFDKAIAQEQAEIKKLKDENAKLLEEAKKAYALGEAKELERDAAYAELEKYGAQARAAVDAQKKAAEEYAKDQADIAIDVPLHVRCLDLCRERAELGYGCKPSAEDYCRVYSGR